MTPGNTPIRIHTDGSCLSTPDGPGGWALVARMPDGSIVRRYGYHPATTNNRMEMTAVLRALQLSDSESPLEIISDSKYVVEGITTWLPGWKANRWRRRAGAIANLDLWQELDGALDGRTVTLSWTKGHDGDPGNELADRLCGQAARQLISPSTEPLPAATFPTEPETMPQPDDTGARTPTGTGTTSDVRQIIVMRTDLGMRKGKMVTQGAHASLAAILAHQDDPRVQHWLDGAFTKICVRADSEEHLRTIIDRARQAGLIIADIVDSGRTEFHGIPTLTCAAIGPDTIEALAPITGSLRLL